MSSETKPFRIAVSDDVLDDLKSRLRRTRWPEAELVDDWSQGVPLKWIEEVCRYWANDYDWRRREALLNRFPQFTTAIDGLKIHFLHVRSPHPGAMPLIITTAGRARWSSSTRSLNRWSIRPRTVATLPTRFT